MPTFNLIDEPWIPCLMVDGRTRCLGIGTVLSDAPAVWEIYDPSPLVTGALHRLLLAILHRVFGPEDAHTWIALWEKTAFDADAIGRELARRRDRFDLFDERYPFYQSAGLNTEEPWPAARLAQELAAKTDRTLFDHRFDSLGEVMPSAVAARYLVATQAFALGGLVTFREKVHKSAKAAPLANAALVVVRGDNLFETLMLNLHRYAPAHGEPCRVIGCDQLAWERDVPTFPDEREPAGYLDWLTWQSRSIRLIPNESGSGVRHVVVMKGHQLPKGVWRRQFETMVPFRARRQAAKDEDPWPALRLKADRALWRDSHALFQTPSMDQMATSSKTVSWLAELRFEEDAPISGELGIDVVGLASNRKSPILWRHERFEFSSAYLGNEELVGVLRSAITLANQVDRLFAAGWFDEASLDCQRPRPLQILADAIVPPSITAPRKRRRQEIKRAKEAARSVLEPLGVQWRYWAALDAHFRRLSEDLPGDVITDEFGTPRYGRERVLPQWADAVRGAAEIAFREGTATLGTTARALRAVALAEGPFNAFLTNRIDRARGAWKLIGPQKPEAGT